MKIKRFFINLAIYTGSTMCFILAIGIAFAWAAFLKHYINNNIICFCIHTLSLTVVASIIVTIVESKINDKDKEGQD